MPHEQKKSYGEGQGLWFSPWVDQVNSINQIMKDTGERNESALLRKLVDEALYARRKTSQSAPLTEKPDNAGGRLETIESLLMNLVRQVGSDRVVMGSDCPADMSYTKPVDVVERLPLGGDDRDKIVGGNAARLLKLA